MSIAQFAERTGMVPSALRFYESKGILVPAERLENGYRYYGFHQIHEAKLVNSLRQSGISLGDIRRFLEAEESTRSELLARWRREAEARLLSVQIASQYLNGMEPGRGSLHLINWEEPLTVIWQTFLVDKPVNSYSQEMKQAAARLHDLNIRTQGSSLIKVMDSLPHAVLIEIGYQIYTESSRKPAPPKTPPRLIWSPSPLPCSYRWTAHGRTPSPACERSASFRSSVSNLRESGWSGIIPILLYSKS